MEVDTQTNKRNKIVNEQSNKKQIIVDSLELELIINFITFVRNRERGGYRAEITTHNGKRSVIVDSTDKNRFDLNPIKRIDDTGVE